MGITVVDWHMPAHATFDRASRPGCRCMHTCRDMVSLHGRTYRIIAVILELKKKCCFSAGPAFIKWGQWAATRPDMFPQDLCDSLAVLQTDSPQHRWDFTRRAVENAFGHPISVVFSEFSHKPVASGSIAQVRSTQPSSFVACTSIFKMHRVD